jgi:cyclophilin family peptidyl-prolyl cis-trans isomerase
MNTTLPRRLLVASVLVVACRAKRETPAAESAKAPPPFDTVIVETSKGRIVMELDRTKAPVSVANFERHIKARFYDGLIFHRIAPNFVIQAGRVMEDGAERTSQATPILNEAENGDFREPTSEGFGYAVFGRVIEGMDVVDAIAATKPRRRGIYAEYPSEPTVIRRLYLKEAPTPGP